MREILKKLNKNQFIGVYRFEMNAFVAGRYLGISSENYIILESYNPCGKKDGYKLIALDTVKRIMIEADYLKTLKEKIKKRENLKKMIALSKNNFSNNFFEKIIEDKILIEVKIGDETERAYLTEKKNGWFYFDFLNDRYQKDNYEAIHENSVSEIEITRDTIRDIEIIDKKTEKKDVIFHRYDRNYRGYIIAKDRKYMLICKRERFFQESSFVLLKNDDIEEITENIINYEKNEIDVVSLFPNILNIEMRELLKKCCGNKLSVFVDSWKCTETKLGVIQKVFKNKILIKETDDNENFFQISEMNIGDLDILYINNYSLESK